MSQTFCRLQAFLQERTARGHVCKATSHCYKVSTHWGAMIDVKWREKWYSGTNNTTKQFQKENLRCGIIDWKNNMHIQHVHTYLNQLKNTSHTFIHNPVYKVWPFDHKIISHSIKMIYSNIVTATRCCNEPQLIILCNITLWYQIIKLCTFFCVANVSHAFINCTLECNSWWQKTHDQCDYKYKRNILVLCIYSQLNIATISSSSLVISAGRQEPGKRH